MSNFDKFCIIPKVTTDIEHRSECIPYYGATWSEECGGWSLASAYLPLFTAPMTCVVDDKNYLEFDKEGIQPIIPRTVSLEKRLELSKNMVWVALGLDEFEKFILDNETLEQETYICVDIANGHMKKLIGLCKTAKRKFRDNLILMAGNIANYNVYDEYAKAGIDYIRVGIGSGSGCRTNDITGVYGGLDLLRNVAWRQRYVAEDANSAYSGRYKSVPKIVWDGGCESIRDVIIALAFGANYVMCGKIFTQAEEAAGEIINKKIWITKTYVDYYDPNPEEDVDEFDDEDLQPAIKYEFDRQESILTPGRMYYGMSTERAQREMGNTKIKHSEGTEFWVPIEYKLHDWTSQFVAAISSSMSYCDAKDLSEFIGKVEIERTS